VSTVHDRARRHPTRRAAWGPRFVGPITALAVWAGIDDAARFARPEDVGAYFGLTPRRYASGEVNRSGRITKRGDGTVRTLLYEAANVLLVKITRSCALREWGLAIAERSGFKKAPRRSPDRRGFAVGSRGLPGVPTPRAAWGGSARDGRRRPQARRPAPPSVARRPTPCGRPHGDPGGTEFRWSPAPAAV